MSAFLLGVGFRADMGTCARKLVLLKLIDACDDDGTRIFPAIATIARAAQCSTRQVQRELQAFRDVGLIRLVKEGGKGPRSTNEYAMDLDLLGRLGKEGWDTVTADKGDTVSPLDEADKGDIGDTLRVTPETDKGDIACHPTPPEPSIDPSEEREAREREGPETQTDDPKKFEQRVKKLAERTHWPAWAKSSTDWTVAQFAKLTDAERAEAERYAAAYVAHCGKGALSIGTYFVERKWRDLGEAVLNPPAPAWIDAPAFGPVWGAVRMRELVLEAPRPSPQPTSAFIAQLVARDDEAGQAERMRRQASNGWPKVTAWHEQAASRRGMSVATGDAGLAVLMEPVPVGSAVYEAWRVEHERRGWPWLPDPGGQRVVYFPVGGPDGLGEFQRSMRGLGDEKKDNDANRPEAAE